MTGRRPERAGRSGGLELIPSVADETERIARELIDASPGLNAAAKQIEQDNLTRHLALGGAGQRTLDGYAISLGPLRALGRNGDFGAAWDGDTIPIPVPVVLAYLMSREGEITHVTAERIVQAVLWVHRNGRWPDAEPDVAALDTTGWENPAAHPAIKNHLAARADGENRPDRLRCLALTVVRENVVQRCRADSQSRCGDRCNRKTTNPAGLCHGHRAAEPDHPAEPTSELRRCQNFTIRPDGLCQHHVDLERCRADLDGWTGSDGTRCPFPAAAPLLCADHQHHPAKGGTPRLNGRCPAADLDEPCPNQVVATHLCRMHQGADPVHPHSLVGVLADEPVILPGPIKKARALRLPDLEVICAHNPEPERLAQLAAVRDTLAPLGIEMWQMADLGPDDIAFTDTVGTVTVQFEVPPPSRRPCGKLRGFPQLEDAEWLKRRYVTDGASMAVIAAEVGCSLPTVSKAVGRHGIEAPFRTVVLVASGGPGCPVAAICAVLANPHHPDPNRPFTHHYEAAANLPGPYQAHVEARDASILPTGFWLGRRGGELGQAQLVQLAVRDIDGHRRVMFTVNPKHSKTGDRRELVLPPCTCEAEITVREPMPLSAEMQALIAAQGDDPAGCRLERLMPKIACRPALCVVCSLARWLAMRWQQPAPTVRCPGAGCGDAALDSIAAFLGSLSKGDRLHRIWPPLNGEWQNPDPFGALATGDISSIVQRRLERAGLDWSSSHGLKRGAVTGMIQAGMDLGEISEITGNQDLKVLAGYIADDVAERRRIEAGQRSLGVLWLPDDQDAFIVGGDTGAA